jgi:hypothetical protein
MILQSAERTLPLREQRREDHLQTIGDIVARQYGITVRHDIKDTNGKTQRGWQSLELREEFQDAD